MSDLEDGKKEFGNSLRDKQTSDSNSVNGTCPHCGYCPRCGRGWNYTYPYPQVQPSPYVWPYQPSTVWCNTSSTVGSVGF